MLIQYRRRRAPACHRRLAGQNQCRQTKEEVAMALMSPRSWNDWISEYSQGHQHPANRLCHTIGIPMIALSILLVVGALVVPGLWKLGLALFVVGWIFQFIGHAYERKPPEFFKDWRFLFVGLRWWLAKLRGKA
jgi:uncharacterized membrane protein YGL010W